MGKHSRWGLGNIDHSTFRKGAEEGFFTNQISTTLLTQTLFFLNNKLKQFNLRSIHVNQCVSSVEPTYYIHNVLFPLGLVSPGCFPHSFPTPPSTCNSSFIPPPVVVCGCALPSASTCVGGRVCMQVPTLFYMCWRADTASALCPLSSSLLQAAAEPGQR